MSAIEGYCYWEVWVLTVTHYKPDGTIGWQRSYIIGVESLGCDGGYSDDSGGGFLVADWYPNGCAALDADSASTNNIAPSGQPTKTLNDLIMGDRSLNTIATYLHAFNALPGNVNIHPERNPDAAAQINTITQNPSSSTLDWWIGEVSFMNYDLTQVLFQELDHQYWTLFGMPPVISDLHDIETVTFGGQQYSFDITPTQKADGTWNTDGYTAYQHFQIYQDVVRNGGVDASGLLTALAFAQNAPTGAALSEALRHNGEAATLSKPGNPMTTTGVTCAGVTASVGRRAESLRMINDAVAHGLTSIMYTVH